MCVCVCAFEWHECDVLIPSLPLRGRRRRRRRWRQKKQVNLFYTCIRIYIYRMKKNYRPAPWEWTWLTSISSSNEQPFLVCSSFFFSNNNNNNSWKRVREKNAREKSPDWLLIKAFIKTKREWNAARLCKSRHWHRNSSSFCCLKAIHSLPPQPTIWIEN